MKFSQYTKLLQLHSRASLMCLKPPGRGFGLVIIHVTKLK